MRPYGEKWEACKAFHGHECSGLAIGYKAALYAEELLGHIHSKDEEVVCVTENDACCNDAIQVILCCTTGKGNLLYHLTGKWRFNFFDRSSGKGFCLAMNLYDGEDPAGSEDYYFETDPHDLFTVTDPRMACPEKARMFKSIPCDVCGEKAAENHIHLENGKRLCEDCYVAYNRPLL